MAQEPTKFSRELYIQRKYKPAYRNLRPPHPLATKHIPARSNLRKPFPDWRLDIIYWSALTVSLYIQTAKNSTIITTFKIWQTSFPLVLLLFKLYHIHKFYYWAQYDLLALLHQKGNSPNHNYKPEA